MKRIFFFTMIMLTVGLTGSKHLRIVEGIVLSSKSLVPLAQVEVAVKGTKNRTSTDVTGKFSISIADKGDVLVFSYPGFEKREIRVKSESWLEVRLDMDLEEILPEEEFELAIAAVTSKGKGGEVAKRAESKQAPYYFSGYDMANDAESYQNWNTEGYAAIHENIFLDPLKKPLSTFSIDVDAASYSNMRRFINNGQKPPKDAVRIEEMINYFNYDYEQPTDERSFSIHSELSFAPWNEKHKLLHIGLKGREIPTKDLPASNLVFLIDVSGSMSDFNKLPLLKSSFKLLVEQLRPQDHVAIVVYAGAAGLVLPPTSGSQKGKIFASLEQLNAGGSTAGGAGIKLAYSVAKENFDPEGNNRVILATDGDFNIGESSDAGMERLIESKRNEGIFLTVLGFGMGNYKDSKMEILADKGNGNYAYIDTMKEAKKVLQNEFGGTMFTIAKDVKIQIEFNPTRVQAYRLIGYENRVLRDEDFNNDKKDAGDLGSGHTVTALYEIVPMGVEDTLLNPIDDLKYQSNKIQRGASGSGELATVKLRYKEPLGTKSKLVTEVIADRAKEWKQSSTNFQWSAAVASFGMILRDSDYKATASTQDVIRWATAAMGTDPNGYRREFLQLVETSSVVASR